MWSKVFTLQTLPANKGLTDNEAGKVAGFSLHAGVAARADQRDKLERLWRYIYRPAVSERCLPLTPNGNVRYQLKTPYRDGTKHVIFEPLDFIARLAGLVPKPRVNLTRFHGVFAPNSKYRARMTRAKRGRGGRHATTADPQARTPAERRAAMTWAQRLKRVFGIDIETCPTGATTESAGTDWRSGWIRVPGRHSSAIGKSDRRQTLAQTDAKRACCGTKRGFILPISGPPLLRTQLAVSYPVTGAA
jgi:hypothetical protein